MALVWNEDTGEACGYHFKRWWAHCTIRRNVVSIRQSPITGLYHLVVGGLRPDTKHTSLEEAMQEAEDCAQMHAERPE